MWRREFLGVLGGAAAAWPIAAHAQQAGMPVIGFLNGASPNEFSFLADAFREGLNETGFIEGQNIRIEYRWAGGQADRMPALVADLVQRRVALIAATGGAGDNVSAVKIAVPAIPVVFLTGNDPVTLGLVASVNRPEGNITGVSFFVNLLGAKRLELLREMIPAASVIGVLADPSFPQFDAFLKDLQTAADNLGRQIQVIRATTGPEIEPAFATLAERRVDALLVSPDPLFLVQREQIVTLAARYRVPVMYQVREFPAIGGLMSYGTSITNAYRQVGVYVGRILKGASTKDLPVVQPTKFELVINLKTAKALGLTVPLTLQVAADEVIE